MLYTKGTTTVPFNFHKEVNKMSGGYNNTFALIVVLFILLIIVGAGALGGYGY